MNGLTLARAFFDTHGRPLLDGPFAHARSEIAAGLVGEGSECFGFDDGFSQDHDFGAGFCLWLPQRLYDEIGASLEDAYRNLPTHFSGYAVRRNTPETGQRVGVFSIEGFYSKYINCVPHPMDNIQWFKIPEHHLATATNGAVFADPLGEFSRIRAVLLDYYPQDVLLKKLAARLGVMAQAGQYNLPRSKKRGDAGAAFLALSTFVEAALSALYLLNRVYMPFYKWAFRGTEAFSFGAPVVQQLKQIAAAPAADSVEWAVEQVCVSVAEELRRRGWSQVNDDFLIPHAEMIVGQIEDVRLRSLPMMFDLS